MKKVFDRLREKVPKFRQKFRIISGDCALPGLGLSPSDVDLLTREISVVFNVAATVRFDEKLKKAIAVNVTGTKELMDLCKRMPALQVNSIPSSLRCLQPTGSNRTRILRS